jgi:hypothetical protein
MSKSKVVIVTAALVLAVIANGCGGVTITGDPGVHQSPPQLTSSSQAAGDCGFADAKVTNSAERALHPIRMAVFQDKSGSAATTRTAQLNEDDFAVPINVLRCTGGELGVGIINDRSNSPLVRLRIEAPPERPRPTQATNPFERAEQEAIYRSQLETFDKQQEQWRVQANQRIATFYEQLKLLLKQDAKARRTSVWPAVARADLFLNEPDTGWSKPTHRYAAFNTDAIDTVHSAPVTMKSGSKLLLVNGAASVGVLGSLNPLCFESVLAAFRFVSATELGGNLK